MLDLIRTELQFSSAVVLSREEVVPRFRVIAPEGQTVVMLPLPDDLSEKVRCMALIRDYMAWRGATAFVLSAEMQTPDAVMALGVTRAACGGLQRPIIRVPLDLGPERMLEREVIGEGFSDLLPKPGQEIDAEAKAELLRVFGTGGEFEARTVN